MWPNIKSRVPNATLDLYHDFPSNYLEEIQRAPAAAAAEMRELYDDVVRLRKQVCLFS